MLPFEHVQVSTLGLTTYSERSPLTFLRAKDKGRNYIPTAQSDPRADKRRTITKCEYCGKLGHINPNFGVRTSFPAPKEDRIKPVLAVKSSETQEKKEEILDKTVVLFSLVNINERVRGELPNPFSAS